MASGLPEFIYHPDPIATCPAVPSDAECECREMARGRIYGGPISSKEGIEAFWAEILRT